MSELVDLLRQGSLTAKEITEQLHITQSTLSRRLTKIPEIVKIGQSRSTRYILPRPLEGQWSFPLYQINEAEMLKRSGRYIPSGRVKVVQWKLSAASR